jgi:hypothetical protein
VNQRGQWFEGAVFRECQDGKVEGKKIEGGGVKGEKLIQYKK